jgi:tripartite-type tricarboxylate transporter receptor subunit TctC
MNQRRRLCAALAAGAALPEVLSGKIAHAQAGSPIHIISPYLPGGGTDSFARAIGQKITAQWGMPVVVENRSGANATIGAAFVAQSKADGNTLLVVATGYASGASLYKNLPYDQKHDLSGVARLASGPLVLVVHPSLPVKDVNELVEYARARPGQLSYASAGVGSLPHLCGELLCATAKIKMTHVPYKGPGASLADVLSGRVPVYFNAIFACLPLVKSGKLRALAVTTPESSSFAPGVPPLAKFGMPDFDMTNWYGLLAPSHTPAAVIAKLNGAVNHALQSPELEELAAASGMTIAAQSPAQFDEFLQREFAKYEKLIRSVGISPA